MHRRRIGMSHSLLPIILSSLLIATIAIPMVPDISAGINIDATETHPQNGPPMINHPITTIPAIPTLPGPFPQNGPPMINHPITTIPAIPTLPGPFPQNGPPMINHPITIPAIPPLPGPFPQNGPPMINHPITTPVTPAVPGPHDGAPNINQPPNSDPALPLQPQDPSSSNMDENPLAKEFLNLHNFARRHAKLPPFVWDVKLEEYAKQYAINRTNSGECHNLVHSMGPYGENLFWGKGPQWKPRDAVKKWVKEHRFYDQSANECKDGKICGHYTQVVWRDSIRLGCAVVSCPNNDTLTVCSYDPPGNYLGEKPSIHYNH